MKVLCVIALFVAVAAAQSADEEPETESTVEPTRPSWSKGKPISGRPNRPPHRHPNGCPDGPRPGIMGIPEFSPIFNIDNVTFQNTTAIQLRDGDNLFIQLKLQLRQRIRSPSTQYLNLIYNSSNANQLSLELKDFKQRLTVFKVENVTFENTTNILLSEGNNIFIRAKSDSKPKPRHRRPQHRPPPLFRPSILGNQYVKLNFDSAEPNQVSIEYGMIQSAAINSILTGLLKALGN